MPFRATTIRHVAIAMLLKTLERFCEQGILASTAMVIFSLEHAGHVRDLIYHA